MSTPTTMTGDADIARKSWWILLGIGLVSLVLGIAIVARPAGSTWVIAVLLAAYLLVSGIFQLARAFTAGLSGGMRTLLIISGALGIILGLIMFRLSPEEKVELFGIFVGISFIFSGISALFASAEVSEGKGWAIFTGIVYLLGGIVLMANPYTVGVFIWVVGIWLIVIGLFEIIASFQVRSAANKAA